MLLPVSEVLELFLALSEMQRGSFVCNKSLLKMEESC